MNYDWYHSSFVRQLIKALTENNKQGYTAEAQKLVDRFEEEQRQVAQGIRGCSIGVNGGYKQN